MASLPATFEVTAFDYEGIRHIAVASDGRWALSDFSADGASIGYRDGRVVADFTARQSLRTLRFRVAAGAATVGSTGPTLSIEAADFGRTLKARQGRARVRLALVTGQACR